MKPGQLYVAPIVSPLDESGRLLIARAMDSTARSHGLQSLAVVLLDAHAFQLPRNNLDGRRIESLAVALVDGRRRRR